MLNVVELVVCVLIVAILVLYFFFWNRFFGLLFSLLARFALWNQEESSVWVKLGMSASLNFPGALTRRSLQAPYTSPSSRAGFSSRTCATTQATRLSALSRGRFHGGIGFAVLRKRKT